MYKPIDYKQYDSRWGKISYSNPDESTTIQRAGCGPTSAAMAIATLVDKTVTPKETAAWALKNGYKCTNGGTYYSFFQNYLPKIHGIPCKQLNSVNLLTLSAEKSVPYHTPAKAWLENGGWLIACMGPGNWTTGGHYILVYGYKDGYVYINDPASVLQSRLKNTWDLFKKQVKYYWTVDVNAFLPPAKAFKNTDATPIQVAWLQDNVCAAVDMAWGPDTAKAVKNKRKSYGWIAGTGYACTDALIKKLSK